MGLILRLLDNEQNWRCSMKRILLIFAASLILVLLAAACNAGSIKVTESMNGQTINAKVGDTIEVVLEGNPTTGYGWYAADLDAAVLSQVGEAEFKAESNLIGAGGMITNTFKAEGPGTVTLSLNYWRPWESVQPLQTFSVTVVVE
jgi:inhibitor of cysteine peptidase